MLNVSQELTCLHENEKRENSGVDFPQKFILKLLSPNCVNGDASLSISTSLVDLLDPFILLSRDLARVIDVRHCVVGIPVNVDDGVYISQADRGRGSSQDCGNNDVL